MRPFDIAPFALPNTPVHEIRFEEEHDIVRVEATFRQPVRRSQVGLEYLHRTWPKERHERVPDKDMRRPAHFGWHPIDDQFNTAWKAAAVDIAQPGPRRLVLTFKPLSAEFEDRAGRYDVRFRRALGVRLAGPAAEHVTRATVFTASAPARTKLRVELDAPRRVKASRIVLSAYHAAIRSVRALRGVRADGHSVRLGSGKSRQFQVEMDHMEPAHRYCHDEGRLTFDLGDDAFTIDLHALRTQGPIWSEDFGVYIALADDSTGFQDYRRRIARDKTVAQQVQASPEQTLGGAGNGQPRPHPVAYSLGCPRSRLRFWLDYNGDLMLPRGNLRELVVAIASHPEGVKDAEALKRFHNAEDGRLFFGLERWYNQGRFPDAPPVLVHNQLCRRDGIELQQKSFALPLGRPADPGRLLGIDDPTAAMIRFRFANPSDQPAVAQLPVAYSSRSRRSKTDWIATGARWKTQDDWQVPLSPRDTVQVEAGRLYSQTDGQKVLRAVYQTSMAVRVADGAAWFEQPLQPGQSCELVLKVPYLDPRGGEPAALEALEFEAAYRQVREFWRRFARVGSTLACGEPDVDALHAGHLAHVQITDFATPDPEGLVNTTVGTSTYGNCCNESCMIIHELDQRGLHDEARKRLALWLKYQGTKGLMGNYSDHDGVLYGAGGFEVGASYNQHHGWVLWRLCSHFFYTGDRDWLTGIADNVIAAADWVFRQRRHTMRADLPHSRGWEYGFLPAGGLEDVMDYCYWLSTNALTWRGTEWAARALEAIGHPQANRIRRESDAYGQDLRRGFETMRRLCPLVRLRSGRWAPYYPSRLYRRGRDYGWIRETLEGSVYLLISGLYDAKSKQAQWILDDFQDNRYMCPPYGYAVADSAYHWFDLGGFSVQPNLLAGLMPYLDRDEPELYVWMFFNAFAACYRGDIQAMVEHPLPWLGWSNCAHFKTSDQANSVMWARAMFVYAADGLLHLGRAIPRDWLRQGQRPQAVDVATPLGRASVRYASDEAHGRISAEVELSQPAAPRQVLVRFRHPRKLAIQSARVNGQPCKRFDPVKGDVDVTGQGSHVTIEARYESQHQT
jgi:hypothetical protein